MKYRVLYLIPVDVEAQDEDEAKDLAQEEIWFLYRSAPPHVGRPIRHRTPFPVR